MTDSTRSHQLEVDGLSAPLVVLEYQGGEAISECFEVRLLVDSEDAFIAFQDVLGKKARLSIACSEENPRYFHGIIQRFEFAFHRSERTGYRAVLVPMAWRLKLRTNNRIFQEKTAVEIIDEVVNEALVEQHQMKLSASYATREYCVQYGESDWAFINRLMEAEGIFFYFKHTEDRAELIFVDGAGAYEAIAEPPLLKYCPPSGLSGEEHVYSLHYGEEVRPGMISTRDYNFKTPGVLLEAKSEAERDTDLELYGFPGNYLEIPPGTELAKRRLEAYQATLRTGRGESNCGRLAPGLKFSLDDTEHGDLRPDLSQEYVLTRVEHHGGQAHPDDGASRAGEEPEDGMGRGELGYRNRFWVVPAGTPFRIIPRTPRPRMHGVQTAVVVGPAGEEIHTDEHGRVKVQFHWDRQGKNDEKSSCWIRVRQPWAGPGWGTLFLPRIGQEVVVEFIEGDPDRPLVSGTVYHATNVPPYPLPDEKTKSTVKSNSSLGGDGFNELRFEDRAGSEEIFIHGQKDWNVVIEHDKNQLIHHDETLVVDNDQTIRVKHDRVKEVDNDQSENIGRDKTITVVRDHTETIERNETLSVGGDRTVSVSKDHNETVSLAQSSEVGGAWTKSVGGSMSLTVGGAKDESVGKDSTESAAGSISVSAGKDHSVTVTRNMTLKVGKDRIENVKEKMAVVVGKELQVQCGEATITVKKDGTVTVKGKNITIEGKGDIKVKGKKLKMESDGAVDVKASGKVTVKGSKVGLN